MTKISVSYEGNLRTRATHLASGTNIITDAPIDNKGKGETFSPTDLVAAAYVSCMLTIIGIFCQENNLTLAHASGDVEKIMESNPRRIGKLAIVIDLQNNDWSSKEQLKVERAARACPVAKSVSEDLDAQITFLF